MIQDNSEGSSPSILDDMLSEALDDPQDFHDSTTIELDGDEDIDDPLEAFAEDTSLSNEVFRELFPIKLLAKLCIENDYPAYRRIDKRLLTLTQSSTAFYNVVNLFAERERRLPNLEELRDHSIGFTKDTLTGSIEHYLEKTIEIYRLNNLSKIFSEMQDHLIKEEFSPLGSKISEIRDILQCGSEPEHLSLRTLGEVIDQVIISSANVGLSCGSHIITTGYAELDDLLIGGYRPQNLYVIAGRQKIGKTTYLLNMAWHAWRSGKRVLALSGEMSVEELGSKVLSYATPISSRSLLRGEVTSVGYDEMRRAGILESTDGSMPAEFWIKPVTRGVTLETIESIIEEYAPDAVYIDSAHLIPAKENTSRFYKPMDQLVDTVYKLKDMTAKWGIPIIVTTHLNRSAEFTRKASRASILPDLSTIAGTDEWAKSASVVFGIVTPSDDTKRIITIMTSRTCRTASFLAHYLPEATANLSIIEEYTPEVEEHSESQERGVNSRVTRASMAQRLTQTQWIAEA